MLLAPDTGQARYHRMNSDGWRIICSNKCYTELHSFQNKKTHEALNDGFSNHIEWTLIHLDKRGHNLTWYLFCEVTIGTVRNLVLSIQLTFSVQ